MPKAVVVVVRAAVPAIACTVAAAGAAVNHIEIQIRNQKYTFDSTKFGWVGQRY